jgi:hypothetical protein
MSVLICTWFVRCVAVVFGVTAILKLHLLVTSPFQSLGVHMLFDLPSATVMTLVSGLEIALAAVCFSRLSILIKTFSAYWLVCSIGAYRAGVWYLGLDSDCGCLGGLGKAIGVAYKNINEITAAFLTIAITCGTYCVRQLSRPSSAVTEKAFPK